MTFTIPTSDELKVAAITSYATGPLHQRLSELITRGIHNIELYCFDPGDMPEFENHLNQGVAWPEALTKCSPHQMAQSICNVLDTSIQTEPRPDISALATYFSDISAPADIPEYGLRIQKVFRWVFEFASALRKKNASCRVIELVAGHRLYRDERTATPKEFRLRHYEPDACFEVLLKRLDQIVKIRDEVFPGDGPVLAFELEPGTTKLVHDLDTLEQLARLIIDYPRVGINLDIGHFETVGIDIEHIFENDLIRDQIAHCHISANASSHFADLCPGQHIACENTDRHMAWCRELVARWRQGELPLFQGIASVELEACGSVELVLKAHNQIRAWSQRPTT